jgi:sec-independent protein translocase protein TatA
MMPVALGMGSAEIGVIVLLVVVLFGAKKLPELGKSLAEGIREFRKASKPNPDSDKPEETDKKQ